MIKARDLPLKYYGMHAPTYPSSGIVLHHGTGIKTPLLYMATFEVHSCLEVDENAQIFAALQILG